MRGVRRVIAGAAALMVAGCTTMPVSGPHSSLISNGGRFVRMPSLSGGYSNDDSYTLIEANRRLLHVLQALEVSGQRVAAQDWPAHEKHQSLYVSVDDVLQVTIYEAEAGGLFIPGEAGVRAGNFVSLPPQTVDKTGRINVPYAGSVKVAGRSTSAIENDIVRRLRNRAIDPQVVISFAQRSGSMISVVGGASSSGSQRFPLSFNGDKVLDAMARAGGVREEGFETRVKLQRRGKEYTSSFVALMNEPAKNVYLKPDDAIYLYRDPDIFTMMGAVGFNGDYRFDKPELMLSEALGRAGGLQDNRADPAEVYVYRHEDKALLDHLGHLGKEDKKRHITSGYDEYSIPTIYKFNLRQADGFFLTQKFRIKHNDIVYVANAESVEFVKFLNILNPGATTTINTRSAVD